MPQIERASDFFAHGQNVAIGIGLHAKKRQNPAHEPAHGGDDRRKNLDHPDDNGRGARCGGLGIGDGIGLGQNLGKDQHQKGHHQGSKRHTAFAKEAGKEGGRQRGRENIHHIVAKQDRTDQPLIVFGDLESGFRSARALLSLRAQFSP